MARILIAEDEMAVREFVERALSHFGHEVTGVNDGSEALALLETTEKPFDLLLTDIVMPAMDGIALALRVTRDWPDLKILMMTGYAHERKRAHNLDILIHEVIAKPFTLEEINEKVMQALNGK